MNELRALMETTAAQAPVEGVGWLLLHSVWQFALIAPLASIGLRLIPRRSSSARYWLMILALVMTLLVPSLTWSLISSETNVLVAVTTQQTDERNETSSNDRVRPTPPFDPDRLQIRSLHQYQDWKRKPNHQDW